MKKLIEVNQVSFSYNPTDSILTNISFNVRSGSFLSIIGPNGAGKSTLLNLICGNMQAKSGTIQIADKNINAYRNDDLSRKIAVVRQEFVPVFDFSVYQVVAMSRIPFYGPLGFANKTDAKIVNEALEATETAKFASRPIASLSAGERQRVFIARAMAQQTDILLLDEPTNFLDPRHQVGIYDLLKTTQISNNKTILAVTHDINLAAQYSDDILLLGINGTHIWGPTDSVLGQEQIENIFGIKFHISESFGRKFFTPLGKCSKRHK